MNVPLPAFAARGVKTAQIYVPIAENDAHPVTMNSVHPAINVKNVQMRYIVNTAVSAETVQMFARIAEQYAETVQTVFARTAVNAPAVSKRYAPTVEYA